MGADRSGKLLLECDLGKADRRDRFLSLARACYDFAAELANDFAERIVSVQAPNAKPRLLCKAELAAALGVSIATIDRDQAIPFFIVGDSRRYDLAAVLAALATKTSSPPRAPTASIGGPRLLSRGRPRNGVHRRAAEQAASRRGEQILTPCLPASSPPSSDGE